MERSSSPPLQTPADPDAVTLLQHWQATGTLPPQLPDTPDAPDTPEVWAACFLDLKYRLLRALEVSDTATSTRIGALAWAIAEATEAPFCVAQAHWCEGLITRTSSYRRALAHFDYALRYYAGQPMSRDLASLHLNRATCLSTLGEQAAAAEALQFALDYLPHDPTYAPQLATLYINAAYVAWRSGAYPQMYHYAVAAEQHAQAVQNHDSHYLALVNQALALMLQGDYPTAERALMHAAHLTAQHCGAYQQAHVALSQARLAIYQGALVQALHLLESARQGFTAADDMIDVAITGLEQASLYATLQMPHEAIHAAQAAAAGCVAEGLSAEALEAYLHVIRNTLETGQLRLARTTLAQAQQLAAQPAATTLHRALLTAYTAHPALQRTPDERDAALARADYALAQLIQCGAIEEQLHAGIIAADLAAQLRHSDAVGRYTALLEVARTHNLPSHTQHCLIRLAQVQRGVAARTALQDAAALARQLRQAMPVEELKARYLVGHTHLYGQLIGHYRKARQPHAAYATLLEAKGGVWSDLAAAPIGPAPDPAWLHARTDVTMWQEEMQLAPTADARAYAEQRLQQALTTLRTYTRQRDLPPMPTVAHVQAALPTHTVGVEYLVHAGRISACVVTATTLQWYDLGKVSRVIELLGRLRLLRLPLQQAADTAHAEQRALAQVAEFDHLLQQLGVILLDPLDLPPSATTLVLAPDGVLFDVAWAALPVQARYLGERYALLLAPSLVVAALPAPPLATAPAVVLGYAGDPPLAHVAEEVVLVADALAAAAIYPATPADVFGVQAPRMLHLAAHAHPNATTPLLSAIQLHGGSLLLADAFRLELQGTSSVVLSACETGITPERGGVLLALAGAFLSAGAHAVLASLWQVNDSTTLHWMRAYYAAIAQGQPIALATQAAQHHLRELGYTHPYFWAAFQPVVRVLPVAG